MKKLRIYLDACVIGNLDEQSHPQEMSEANALWEMIKMGEFYVVISEVALDELNDNKNFEKVRILSDYLNQITYETLPLDSEIEHIAELIKKSGLIPSDKKLNDRRHIAGALVSRSDILVSTNYKDLVNVNTVMGVKKIAIVEGYGAIEIFPPQMLIGRGEK